MRGKTVRLILALVLGVALAVSATPSLAQTIELKGASQFDDTHSYNQTMLKFEEEVKKCYSKPIKFTLHRNRELGLEKDYVNYMTQGRPTSTIGHMGDDVPRPAGRHVPGRGRSCK